MVGDVWRDNQKAKQTVDKTETASGIQKNVQTI